MSDNFKFETLDQLNPFDAKEYIKKYFIPLTDGGHAILENGEYKVIEEIRTQSK